MITPVIIDTITVTLSTPTARRNYRIPAILLECLNHGRVYALERINL